MARLRLATFRDAITIQDLLWTCQEMSDTPYPDPDIPFAAQRLMWQANEGNIAVWVDDNDIPRGAIVLAETVWPWKHPMSPDAAYLHNEHFFIDPNFRKGGAAKQMLAWAKNEAKSAGKMLMLDFSTLDGDVAYKDRFARINGMVHTGGKFLYAPSKDE